RRRVARLVEQSPDIRAHIEEALRVFNGRQGEPQSFDLLHDLLEAQAYRLAYWRTAAHEINYRRFFDINALAGIRMERREVFDGTHVLVADLIRSGRVSGLRIDHPDGLFDPQQYFQWLQGLAARSAPPGTDASRGLYVVAEKILSRGEELPPSWPVCGTTGYNFLNELNGLFVDPAGARELHRIYRRVSSLSHSFEEVAYESKKLITESALASELNVLADALNRISERNRRSRDFPLNRLRRDLEEVVACFPVYRTYVGPGGWSAEDRRVIVTAVDRSRRRNPAMESSIFDFILEVLLPRAPDDEEGHEPAGRDRRTSYPPPEREHYEERLAFSMKFQQYTAPVQAKGVEDTAFYRYNVLVSLNEVGGDPARVGRPVEEFHSMNRRRLERAPYGTLTTATHDTKLGEDVRARIDVLSEIPGEWARTLSRAMRINAQNRRQANGALAPDRNDEYRFYQVLLGILPPQVDADPGPGPEATAVPDDFVGRLRDYMLKAVHEAKVHTSWINPNENYDQGVAAFVERSLTGPTSKRFLAALDPLRRRVARLGALNSLAQLVLKATAPGVTDIYQGTELWDLSLVDPDNRRLVDYETRMRMLDDMEEAFSCAAVDAGPSDAAAQERFVGGLVDEWRDDRIKLFVTAAVLRLRRSRPDLFLRGDYVPLAVEMAVAASLVSFARVRENDALVVAVPRLAAALDTPGFARGTAWRE
ncbi:MAG: malto-oligosyltrehalose synthase, partial [Acidobacteria bacterium]